MTGKSKSDRSLLTVNNLSLEVSTEQGRFPLVRDVSFQVEDGQVLGIVGESGSGKTVTCLSLTRLLPHPPIHYTSGEVHFEGRDLWKLSERNLQQIRSTGIGIIFQDALNALNPVLKIGRQIDEVFTTHLGMKKEESRKKALELLELVGLPSPEILYRQYPHQLSGGMQQRVMIAMALAGRPRLLIADEPTTALDVTIQVQIMELLGQLREELGMAIIFVNHDLGLIAEICDQVLVMYAGEVVETAATTELFMSPRHPYTRALLKSIPRLDAPRSRFSEIPGQVPTPAELPGGCNFHPRCILADKTCAVNPPPLTQSGKNSSYRCWHPLNHEHISTEQGPR